MLNIGDGPYHDVFSSHLDLTNLGGDTYEAGRRRDDEETILPGLEVDAAPVEAMLHQVTKEIVAQLAK